LSRWNGIAAAVENFNSRLSSRPANNGPSRNSAISAATFCRSPAMVPLMPSVASSSVPFRPSRSQSSRSGARNSRKSGSATNW